MKTSIKGLLLGLCLGLPPAAHADSAVTTTDISADAGHTGQGRSVYEVQPWVDGPVLGAAALGASVPLFFQSRLVHKQCPCDPADVNSFDRPVIHDHSNAAAWTSHFVVALAIATPIVLDYKDLGWSKSFGEDMVVFTEVLSIDSSLSNLARYTVQRPRPEAYRQSPAPGDSGTFLSFYSGHAASTFAALSAASMTYGYRYGHRLWPWLATGGIGLGEAYLRSAAGKHFYTDNIVGILVGTTVGTVVPMLHKRHGPSSVMLVPEDHGAQLVWRKTF